MSKPLSTPSENMPLSVYDLITIPNLSIPNYQRPYEWKTEQVSELLDDFENILKKHDDDVEYRVGTIILHRHKSQESDVVLDIVDGQQRVITFCLLAAVLFENNQEEFQKIKLLQSTNYSDDNMSKNNLYNNYKYIKNRLNTVLSIDSERKKWTSLISECISVVKLEVEEIHQAFQLFDCQNSRGKSLYPHDLLKAYHLRSLRDDEIRMLEKTKQWEKNEPRIINSLLDSYLFSIYNWKRGYKTWKFSDSDIDCFKGIPLSSGYTYALKAQRVSPYFQIGEPFISGAEFFDIVSYYLSLTLKLKNKFEKKSQENFISFSIPLDILEILNNKGYSESTSFSYVKTLFYSAILHYYDRFNNFDLRVVIKLFTWSFMLRCDLQSFGLQSINKYAVGDNNEKYTNNICMFSKISYARKHNEIADLDVHLWKSDSDYAKKLNQIENEKWKCLYKELLRINGIEFAEKTENSSEKH